DERTPATVRLLISRVRNVDHVVARKAKDRSQRLEHAEYQVRPAIDAELLAHRSVRGRVGKQILQHVRTDNTDVTTGCAFTLGPDASRIDAHAVDIKHRDRLDAADSHILG